MENSLLLQEWEESEAGWGVRDDGYSFHLTEEDAKLYLKAYWDSMPKEVQHEYSRACGNPVWVKVTSAFFEKIKKAIEFGPRKGVHIWNSDGKVVMSKTGERFWEESKKQ